MRSLTLLALLTACTPSVEESDVPLDTDVDTEAPPLDADGDGFVAESDGGDDCDDDDADVHPGATELCDAIDQDCDGDTLEDFEDLDRDETPDCVDQDACAPVPAGLVVWMAEGDGVDLQGDIDVIGTASSADGIVGTALDLSTGPLASGALDVWLTGGAFSIEAWIRTTPIDASQTVLSHYECGGDCSRGGRTSPSSYSLSVDKAGLLSLVIRDGDAPTGTPGDQLTSVDRVDDDVWHHVVGVSDPVSGELRMYIDGALESRAALVHNDGSGFNEDGDGELDPVTIGFGRASGSGQPVSPFLGLVDELSFYTTSLDDAAVSSLHGAGLAGKCEP